MKNIRNRITILWFVAFKYIPIIIAEIKFLAPLIANGDHGTTLMQRPPILKSIAAINTQKIPFDCFIFLFPFLKSL